MSSKNNISPVSPGGQHEYELGHEEAPAPHTGHNRSAQHGVETNPDPALDYANEHHHPHIHHGKTAQHPEEKDVVVYAKGAANKDYLGAGVPDYKVRQMSSNSDEESGRVGQVRNVEDEEERLGKTWSFRRVYAKYKIGFHLAIWAVWTA